VPVREKERLNRLSTPETLLEGVYDVEKNLRLFEESNRRRIAA